MRSCPRISINPDTILICNRDKGIIFSKEDFFHLLGILPFAGVREDITDLAVEKGWWPEYAMFREQKERFEAQARRPARTLDGGVD